MFYHHPLATLLPYTTLFRSTLVATADAMRRVNASTAFGVRFGTTGEDKYETEAWAEFSKVNERLMQLARTRSEEHTSELQSRGHIVCRLLLEKKKEKDTQEE